MYKNISLRLITALSYRWHAETNIFHLPVGELTITLDDGANLIDIPIVGRLMGDEDIDYESYGVVAERAGYDRGGGDG